MPENVQHQQIDRPLEAPLLLELSAGIVANNAEYLLISGKYLPVSIYSQPSSSKVAEPKLSSPHGHSRVVGLRDPAAEQALVQHQTFLNKQQQTTTLKGLLPVRASEIIFNKLCDKWRNSENNPSSPEEIDNGLQPFYQGHLCPLAMVDLSNMQITDRILAALLVNQRTTLTSLSLISTKGLTAAGLCSLLQKSKIKLPGLRSLKLNSLDILRVPRRRRYHPYVPTVEGVGLERALDVLITTLPQYHDDSLERFRTAVRQRTENLGNEVLEENELGQEKLRAIVEYDEAQIESPSHFMQFCPELEHLYLVQGHTYNIEDEAKSTFLTRILADLIKLHTLDLSEWVLHDLSSLQRLQSLTILVLYEVRDLEDSINTIATFKTLKRLDISQSDRSNGHYIHPVTALHKLITSLPNLQSLDISGTNLTVASSENDRPFRGTGKIDSDIPGLCFLERPLQFLGIFNCDSSSQYKNIPALKISGDQGEDQVITAMEMYLDRPKTMQAVLNESYQLYRFGSNLHRYVEALHLVLRALKMHLYNGSLQIAGSASMFYIIRNVKMNRDTKRLVIMALLDGMENHLDEQVMVRNCCLSLCQFDIPQEILFNYGRVANLLVKVLEHHNSDALTQRIVVFLLNSMACHVEGEQKIEVGVIGAIEIILQQIQRKLNANTCDDVMEVGWSFLWNITDETPDNCDRFLKANGLFLFSQCYQKFGDRCQELVRNMMGLIGNIAEVEELRDQLMKKEYLEIFCKLLDNLSEGIEISYNSAGVLAHLVSDSEERWKKSGVEESGMDQYSVSKLIVQATGKWDLKARRFINYRSFKPILRLLPKSHAVGAQQWAVWALANLTTTDKQKYCRFVVEEGGVELLEQLLTDQCTTPGIRELANTVLNNIKDWNSNVEVEVDIDDLEMVDN